MDLPQDVFMLYSLVNMKLRDSYKSLNDMCSDMMIDKESLVEKLKSAGFEYNSESNKFI